MADTTTAGNLQVSVEQPSSYQRTLSVTVPAERVKRIRQSVRASLTRNARVPGFRRGHLPDHIVEKQFGAAINQETVDRVIQETYPEALKQENITPIAQGEVADVHYHGEGGDLHYHVNVEVQPQIEIARTSGFVVARPSDAVGDDEVDSILERMRSERATLELVDDRKPDLGDEVQVRITAPRPAGEEGEPEPQEYRFVMGEGQAIAPIEEAIMSLMPGEEEEFDISYPEDFDDPDLAGTTQHMTIGVVELKARTFPELDDEFAASVGPFDSMDALRERIGADLREDARRRADAGVRDALIGQILEANPVEAPRSMVDRYLDYMTGGMQGGNRPKRTPEQEERFSQFREMMRPQAEASLKRMLVIETLADQHGLRATQDEVDARVELIAQGQGRSPSDVWLELEKSGQLQSLEAEVTEDKVFDWLRAQNTVG
ncbi:MAG TPA: trigger factor [Longimicrobiaceae bacterium]|nr:trigger factor [Longimicrobiaceae bacterium]